MTKAKSATEKLYTPAILGLSASLALYPYGPDFERHASARSKVCGSSIELGLDCDDDGRVSRIGMQVSACAIGQASAAVLAGAINGKSRAAIEEALHALEGWLAGEEAHSLPDWPGISVLEPARAHAGRHGALLLPWRAAAIALSPEDQASEALSSSDASR